MNTYTEEQLKAAVAEATAELTAKLSKFEANAAESDIEKRVEAAKAEIQTQLDELQAKYDTAVLEAQAEKDKREALEGFLASEAERVVKEAETAARKDERLAKIREVVNFPETHIEANAERFAAMSDEDFEKNLADWAAIAPKDAGSLPKTTALHASREGDPANKGDNPIREVMGLRFAGVDPRTV